MDKVLKTFDAPDFVTYYIFPVVILTFIGYLIGLPFVVRDVSRGGYNTVTYPLDCVKENRERCKNIYNKKEFDECLNNQNVLRCEAIRGKGGKFLPLLAFFLSPLIIALIIGSLFYKLLIFIRNPKVAAGYMLFK